MGSESALTATEHPYLSWAVSGVVHWGVRFGMDGGPTAPRLFPLVVIARCEGSAPGITVVGGSLEGVEQVKCAVGIHVASLANLVVPF